MTADIRRITVPVNKLPWHGPKPENNPLAGGEFVSEEHYCIDSGEEKIEAKITAIVEANKENYDQIIITDRGPAKASTPKGKKEAVIFGIYSITGINVVDGVNKYSVIYRGEPFVEPPAPNKTTKKKKGK